MEELAHERQQALVAEGTRLSQARAIAASRPSRSRGRRVFARTLHALAVRVDELEVARIHSA
jgi:hypothetical protein